MPRGLGGLALQGVATELTTKRGFRMKCRRREKRWIGASVAAAAAVCTSGVAVGVLAPTANAAQVRPAASSTPKEGGTFDYLMGGQGTGMNPTVNIVSNPFDAPPMEAVFGLLTYENSTTGATEMGMAQSLTSSDGGKVWTLVLTPGIKFSDGTPLNAAAVRYNILRDANPNNGSPFLTVAQSLRMRVVNATTLQFTLPAPDTQWDALFTQDFTFIGSPKAEAAEGQSFGQNPVGAGPFLFKQDIVGTSITFTKNPNYYIKGEPYIDTLVLLDVPAESQGEADLATGTGQFGNSNSPAENTQLRGAGLTVKVTIPGGGNAIYMEDSTPPFNNLVARQAITYAFERTVENADYDPNDALVTSLFPKTSPYFSRRYQFNLTSNFTKAQALFNQLAAAGTPLKFNMIVYASPVTEAVGSYMESRLAQFQNVSMTVTPLLGPEFLTDYEAGTYQMANADLYWVNPYPEVCDTFSKGGPLNYFKWNDPVVNKICAEIPLQGPSQQQADYDAIISEFNKQDPIIFTDAVEYGSAWPKTVAGVHLFEYGNVALLNTLGFAQ